MESIFELFGQPVTGYAVGCVCALTAVLLAVWCAGRMTKLSYNTFISFAVLAVPFTVVCSRVCYCAAEYVTMDSIERWLDVGHGGFSIMGAFAGIVLAALCGERLSGCKDHPVMNSLMVALPVGIIIERLCEAGTGTGLGKELPEMLYAIGVEDPDLGVPVHPVYMYEAIVGVILLIALAVIFIRRKGKFVGCDGLLTFMTLFGTTQVFLEAFRSDRHMYIHFVQVEQVIAIVLAVIALVVWLVRYASQTGDRRGVILRSVIVSVCIGLTVFMEFRLDRGSLKLLYYSVIALCMAVACAINLRLFVRCGTPEEAE